MIGRPRHRAGLSDLGLAILWSVLGPFGDRLGSFGVVWRVQRARVFPRGGDRSVRGLIYG